MGVTGEGFVGDIPLIIAFVILAAFTYSSGLRAPASIAIVKDLLIYVTAFAAAIIIPIHLGGFGKIFAAVPTEKLLLAVPQGYTTGAYSTYATLALGSALALLLYPHTMTAILSATSGHTVRRNAALLPAYTFVLGLLALLGFFALADGVDKLPEFAEGFRQFKNNFAVPALFLHNFPSWFAGVAFAAIGIGALVPAAIMSIAAANLFTRNVYREFFHPRATDKQEAQMAKWVSLIVKFGALSFIVFVPLQYAIQLQLLGGILDHPNLADRADRALHAMVQRVGTVDRMGGRHLRRYLHGGLGQFCVDLLPDDRQLDLSGLHCGLRVDPQSGHRHRGNAANEYPRRETTGPDRSGRLLRLIPPPQLIELTPRDPACSQLQSERSLCRIVAAVPADYVVSRATHHVGLGRCREAG